MKKIYIIIAFCTGVAFLCSQNVFSQRISTLTLKYNITDEQRKELSFPCFDLINCIDTIVQCGDTLYVNLQDNRVFSISGRGNLVICIEKQIFLPRNNFKLYLKIKKEISNIEYINLTTFDIICLFKREKENIYKLIHFKENKDYSNKKFIDFEEYKKHYKIEIRDF